MLNPQNTYIALSSPSTPSPACQASYQLRRSGLCPCPLCAALDSTASVDVHGSPFVSDCSPGSGKPLDQESLAGMERY